MVEGSSVLFSSVFSYIRSFLYGAVIVIPVTVTFCDHIGFITTISGRSMRPTFNPEASLTNDRVWLSKWNMASYKPKPGDIIALNSPVVSNKNMVKRVIAIEGQTICTRSYRQKMVTIPAGHCWVEGDNPRTSQDSNFYGPVSYGLIYGKVLCVIWPPTRWRFVSHDLVKRT